MRSVISFQLTNLPICVIFIQSQFHGKRLLLSNWVVLMVNLGRLVEYLTDCYFIKLIYCFNDNC